MRGEFVQFRWDEELPSRLHVLHADNSYHRLRFSHQILKSASLAEENRGTVAVIDGQEVLLTPFKFHNTKHASPAIHVSFSPTLAAEDIAVLLSDGTIDFRGRVTGKPGDVVEKGTLRLSAMSFSIRQIAWIQPLLVLALGFDAKLGGD
ncbi:hypothetical protein HDU91_004164, partial [Kappamyces sp. JEL0680]